MREKKKKAILFPLTSCRAVEYYPCLYSLILIKIAVIYCEIKCYENSGELSTLYNAITCPKRVGKIIK